MHTHVERIIGRLATDPDLLNRFAEQPDAVLRELGLELTPIEFTALAATDPHAFRDLSAALDARLRRATSGADRRPGRPAAITPNSNDSGKEN